MGNRSDGALGKPCSVREEGGGPVFEWVPEIGSFANVFEENQNKLFEICSINAMSFRIIVWSELFGSDEE